MAQLHNDPIDGSWVDHKQITVGEVNEASAIHKQEENLEFVIF